MIKPIRHSEIIEMGWYIHIDFNHQLGKNIYSIKPYGGWFYEKTPEGWRDETGCLDCGPFDPNDMFIGPVEVDHGRVVHQENTGNHR